MAVSYRKLWHILLDKNMKKKDLQEQTGISNYSMRKLSNNESVTTDIIVRICRCLNCSPNEVMDILPDNNIEV